MGDAEDAPGEGQAPLRPPNLKLIITATEYGYKRGAGAGHHHRLFERAIR